MKVSFDPILMGFSAQWWYACGSTNRPSPMVTFLPNTDHLNPNYFPSSLLALFIVPIRRVLILLLIKLWTILFFSSLPFHFISGASLRTWIDQCSCSTASVIQQRFTVEATLRGTYMLCLALMSFSSWQRTRQRFDQLAWLRSFFLALFFDCKTFWCYHRGLLRAWIIKAS